MNLDELRSVRDQERAKDSLQNLRDSFYEDVGKFIRDLKHQREELAEQAENPFDSDDFYHLTDDIDTAEETIESIYQRRVGKIVKQASFKASGMPADDEGLTKKEQELFSRLVQCIKSNKEEVLDVLAGEETGSAPTTTDSTSGPDGAPSPSREVPADDPPALSEDVSAADVMGGGASEATAGTPDSDPFAASADGASADAATAETDDPRPAPDEAAAVAGGPDDEEDSDDERDPLAGLDERTTIRITRDVGEIFGVDERTYDLENEDVVTLPEENAGPLVEQGAAEELE